MGFNENSCGSSCNGPEDIISSCSIETKKAHEELWQSSVSLDSIFEEVLIESPTSYQSVDGLIELEIDLFESPYFKATQNDCEGVMSFLKQENQPDGVCIES